MTICFISNKATEADEQGEGKLAHMITSAKQLHYFLLIEAFAENENAEENDNTEGKVFYA